jgi:hypothetical protein
MGEWVEHETFVTLLSSIQMIRESVCVCVYNC